MAGWRALLALALLLVLAAGWSGRLHAEPYEQHRVCFANELDPSFERAAQWLANADLPIICADRMGRSPEAFAALGELASLLSIPVLVWLLRVASNGGVHFNPSGAGRENFVIERSMYEALAVSGPP